MHRRPTHLPLTLCRRCRVQAIATRAQWPSRSTADFQHRRRIQIQATPSVPLPGFESAGDSTVTEFSPPTQRGTTPDARFEVVGPNSSLLSISLSASQPLHTRRGTLIAAASPSTSTITSAPSDPTVTASSAPKPTNEPNTDPISTLSVLPPFRRAVAGIPFLYQKITAPTPLSLLIGGKSANTTFAVVHLDGRTDWVISRRDGIVAWTGQRLSILPGTGSGASGLGMAHWGASNATGRGLLALAGTGGLFQAVVGRGETFVVHPSNVLAYTLTPHPPQPYRFKSTSLRLQVPSVSSFLPDTKFFRVMRESATFQTLGNILYTIRTWTRRTIWGDRLFLRFYGPTTLLIQSRGAHLRDTLSHDSVNEIADAPAGAISPAVTLKLRQEDGSAVTGGREERATEGAYGVGQPPSKGVSAGAAAKATMSFASVGKDGKVRFGTS